MNECIQTNNIFIFSLKGHENIDTARIGRVIKKYGRVLWCYNNMDDSDGDDCNIIFGSCGKWTYHPYAYPDINISENYEIEDYEVFQVVEKQ